MQLKQVGEKSGCRDRVATAFVLLSPLPFILCALPLLWRGSLQFGQRDEAILLIVAGGIFGFAGAALFVFICFGFLRKTRIDALHTQYPGQPWMWREDWARGCSKYSAKRSAIQ